MYRIRSYDRTPLKITEPSAFFLAEKTHNSDLEENSCKGFSPKFFSVAPQRTFFNQMLNAIFTYLTKEKEGA
tara:strand:+ start:112 stop:327 length:216 start_codon:yes stop_codon:yes gene_type:complete